LVLPNRFLGMGRRNSTETQRRATSKVWSLDRRSKVKMPKWHAGKTRMQGRQSKRNWKILRQRRVIVVVYTLFSTLKWA